MEAEAIQCQDPISKQAFLSHTAALTSASEDEHHRVHLHSHFHLTAKTPSTDSSKDRYDEAVPPSNCASDCKNLLSITTMDQSRALNALAPHLALAKSATSPRAAADLVTQATSAPNTFVFAELLAQPNVQKLKGDEQYASVYRLGELFAWGSWEQYKGMLAFRPTITTRR